MHFKLVDNLFAFFQHFAPIYKRALCGLIAQKVVFGNAQIRRDGYALVICEHAVALRLYRVCVNDPLAVVIHGNAALVQVFNPHDTLDQGRFSRTVFAAQRPNLAPFQFEADVVERGNARIKLADMLNLQNGILQNLTLVS